MALRSGCSSAARRCRRDHQRGDDGVLTRSRGSPRPGGHTHAGDSVDVVKRQRHRVTQIPGGRGCLSTAGAFPGRRVGQQLIPAGHALLLELGAGDQFVPMCAQSSATDTLSRPWPTDTATAIARATASYIHPVASVEPSLEIRHVICGSATCQGRERQLRNSRIRHRGNFVGLERCAQPGYITREGQPAGLGGGGAPGTWRLIARTDSNAGVTGLVSCADGLLLVCLVSAVR